MHMCTVHITYGSATEQVCMPKTAPQDPSFLSTEAVGLLYLHQSAYLHTPSVELLPQHQVLGKCVSPLKLERGVAWRWE